MAETNFTLAHPHSPNYFGQIVCHRAQFVSHCNNNIKCTHGGYDSHPKRVMHTARLG